MNELLQIAVPIIVAFIVGVPGVLAYLSNRSKNDADAAKLYAEAAEKVIADNAKLRIRIDNLESKLEDWQIGIEILIRQIERRNEVPEWRPKRDKLAP